MADYLSREQFEDRLHHELGVKREGKKARHPVSGWKIEVGKHTRKVPGSSPPQEQIFDHGHFPGRGQQPRSAIMLPRDEGTRPIKHVYRGVSEEDFQGIQQRGTIHSDQRGNISQEEGTNSATDPRSAAAYLPQNGPGRILKIRVHPEDNWQVASDGYIKTHTPVPVDRIVRHTGVINKDQMGRFLT